MLLAKKVGYVPVKMDVSKLTEAQRTQLIFAQDGRVLSSRYLVTGSPEELAQFRLAQGPHYREENGRATYLTAWTRLPMIGLDLGKDGKVYINKSMYTDAQHTAQELGGALGQAVLERKADQIAAADNPFAAFRQFDIPVKTEVTENTEVETPQLDDLGDI